MNHIQFQSKTVSHKKFMNHIVSVLSHKKFMNHIQFQSKTVSHKKIHEPHCFSPITQQIHEPHSVSVQNCITQKNSRTTFSFSPKTVSHKKIHEPHSVSVQKLYHTKKFTNHIQFQSKTVSHKKLFDTRVQFTSIHTHTHSINNGLTEAHFTRVLTRAPERGSYT